MSRPQSWLPLKLRARGEGGGGCQRGLARERVLHGAAAHSSEVTALPPSPSHSLVMPSAV